jgi:hypothetical protein
MVHRHGPSLGSAAPAPNDREPHQDPTPPPPTTLSNTHVAPQRTPPSRPRWARSGESRRASGETPLQQLWSTEVGGRLSIGARNISVRHAVAPQGDMLWIVPCAPPLQPLLTVLRLEPSRRLEELMRIGGVGGPRQPALELHDVLAGHDALAHRGRNLHIAGAQHREDG